MGSQIAGIGHTRFWKLLTCRYPHNEYVFCWYSQLLGLSWYSLGIRMPHTSNKNWLLIRGWKIQNALLWITGCCNCRTLAHGIPGTPMLVLRCWYLNVGTKRHHACERKSATLEASPICTPFMRASLHCVDWIAAVMRNDNKRTVWHIPAVSGFRLVATSKPSG